MAKRHIHPCWRNCISILFRRPRNSSATSLPLVSILLTESLIKTLISLAAAVLRQAAHLGRYDHKLASLFPSTRRFDSRIQRSTIGLENNAVNDANNIDNLLNESLLSLIVSMT